MSPKIELLNVDCLEYMKGVPDKYFELAIVDPPYGIGGGSNTIFGVDWDESIPEKEYFKELCRVSKNQIIWGGNYMALNIPFNSTHSIVWDKQNGESFMSDGEIAFTSFDKNTTKFFRLFWMSNMMKPEEKPLIHPTQKPIKLYKWLLMNYAKQGDKILDTHGGSRSLAIACYEMGFDHVSCEIDKDYHDDSIKRFKEKTMQQSLFNHGGNDERSVARKV